MTVSLHVASKGGGGGEGGMPLTPLSGSAHC